MKNKSTSQNELDSALVKAAPTLQKFHHEIFSPLLIDLSINTSAQIQELQRSFEQEDKIDQRYLYTDTQSYFLWKGVLTSDSYPTYERCKSTLSELTKSDYWKEIVSDTPTSNLIDLGVGAGDKDYEILTSFAKHCQPDEKVKLVLVDTSLVMLDVTLSELREHANNLIENTRRRIEIQGIRTSFMRLGGIEKYLQESEQKNIYFLLGGTFSNLDESAFMRNFSKACRPGDILIMSVEYLDENNPVESLNSTRDSYNVSAVERFASIPIYNHLRQAGVSAKMITGSPKPSVHFGPEYSDIDGAGTLAFHVNVDGRNVQVISTSRYPEAALKTFLRNFNFEISHTVSCPENKYFKYLCIEKKAS